MNLITALVVRLHKTEKKQVISYVTELQRLLHEVYLDYPAESDHF